MRLVFECPGDCNYALMIHAMDKDEAVDIILEKGGVHRKQVHPEMPPVTKTELINVVRLAKHEDEGGA